MSKFEKDLTSGSVIKNLILFSLPFVLSNFIQSLYSVCDMIIIGNYTSVECLNGVSNATQLTMLFTNAVIGLSVGGTVLIGQYIGSGNKGEIKKSIATLFTLLLIIGVSLSLISPLICSPVLKLMHVDADCMGYATSYFITVMSGTVFVFAYNALAGVMRGMGDSKHPMIFVAIAAAVNIGLDLIFVGACGMEAFGAALATIISQAISVILCIVYLRRNDFVFDFHPKSFRIDKPKLKTITRIGFPTMLNNICTSLSFVFLMSMANITSSSGGGAVGVVGKYNGFAILPAIGVSSAISAMVAQNFGAGDIKRVKRTLFDGMIIAEGITVVIFILTRLFPEQILRLFNDDEVFLELGKEYISSFSFDYIIVPFQFCFSGLFIGSGHTAFALLSGMCSSLLFRIPFCWLLGIVLEGGMKGIGAGAPIASLAATLISLVFFMTGKWKKQKLELGETAQ
ncbi:MAG: MATE family efflux transporter [Clostridia bacterium]|nr:MATE family efflux transporter [Clostridia bacterium]